MYICIYIYTYIIYIYIYIYRSSSSETAMRNRPRVASVGSVSARALSAVRIKGVRVNPAARAEAHAGHLPRVRVNPIYQYIYIYTVEEEDAPLGDRRDGGWKMNQAASAHGVYPEICLGLTRYIDPLRARLRRGICHASPQWGASRRAPCR